MENKLILKMKFNKENRSLSMQTEGGKFDVKILSGVKDYIASVLEFTQIDYEEINKLETISLYNLQSLLEKGFTIRIDEVEEYLRFIAYKGQASTSCGVSKVMGISSLLKNAEDFAETLLEDLKTNTACGL